MLKGVNEKRCNNIDNRYSKLYEDYYILMNSHIRNGVL